jgi:hypothetical protein
MAKATISAKNYLTVGPGDYSCGDNLYLIVSPTGEGRRWLFRYQFNKVKDSMGFGAAKDVKLADAKNKAIDARRLLAKGISPKEARDEARRAEGSRLFGEFATEWRERYEKNLRHENSRAKLKRIVEVITLPLHKDAA